MRVKIMNTKQYLEKTIYVKIDRPLGSTHPKFNNIILFDLDYSNTEKERIKKNILDRSNSKLIVLNIDNPCY